MLGVGLTQSVRFYPYSVTTLLTYVFGTIISIQNNMHNQQKKYDLKYECYKNI